jgi:cell division septal protein FtsQ
MGIRRRSKNRRLTKRNILDVKLRTRGARMARLRLAATALAVALGMVAGLYGLWRGGEIALDRLVFQNESFAVRRIQVQNEGVIAPAEIVRWSGVKEGDNLLGLDLNRVQRYLELMPLIRSAAVERVPPDILRIRVEEREPIARVMAHLLAPSGQGTTVVNYYLDEEGYVMGWADGIGGGSVPERTNGLLPVLEGLTAQSLRSGQVTVIPEVKAALRLVSAFDRSAMAERVLLESVDLTVTGLIQVQARSREGGQVSQIRFGYEEVEEQLWRWRRIDDYSRRQRQEILTLDLSVRDNIPVVFAEPDAQRYGAAPTAASGSLKRRHV